LAHDQRNKGGNTIYRRIYDGGYDRVDRIKACNANGKLVVFGTDVDRNFVNNKIDPTMPLAPPRSNIAGGHCMVVVGYLPGDIFIIGNSYGSGWGNGGFCLFGADYMTDLITRDLWMVDKAAWFSELS
jgi:hypothetical protein